MSDDLIGTAEVARRLGVSVATVNRWATTEGPLLPALTVDGPERAAARLYHVADVEAYMQTRIDLALARGACANCTTALIQTWHKGGPCPYETAAAS